MRCSTPQAAAKAALLALTLLFSTAGLAAPTTNPADVTNPVIEDFEGYIGVSIPDSGFGAGVGLPPTGFVFNSGLTLTGPSPNTDDGMIVIDAVQRTYGCCVNSITSSADIISGIAFAGDGNPAGSIQTFEFPVPTQAFGLYVGSDTTVTLTAYDAGGGVLETQVFGPLNTPLTVASFVGIVSATPVASFSIESASFFVYDDITFSEATGELYRISLDGDSDDFSVYNIATDTWITLTPFPSSTQMATSTDGRLFGWSLTDGEIQEYDPGTDTWSFVQAAPPTPGLNGNLEYLASGEWAFTKYNDSTLHYTVAGVWQTLTLPFPANSVGDYDPDSDTLVVGQYNTSFFHAIDMGTLAITSFTLDMLANGERGRCGQIRDGRFYYQTDGNPLRYLDLSNNAAAPVDVMASPPNFASCAVSETAEELFIGPLDGTTLTRIFLDDFSTEALTGHTDLGNHSSLTWVGPGDEEVLVADLTVIKTDDADPVAAGTNVTYTVRVDNAGTGVADDVVVTDTLPAGVILVSTTGCTEDPAGVPSCSLGSIDAGSFAEFTVTVTVDPAVTGLITNNVSVATSSDESNTDNNSASEDTTVFAEADLSITKIDNSDPVVSGTGPTLVYTIEVSNAGPSDATNVVVTDILPEAANFVSTDGCLNDPDGVPDCQLGTIAAGASASYDITVSLNPAGGTIVNQVSVTSDASDPNGDNDSIYETTDVEPIVIPALGIEGLGLLILLLAGFGWVAVRRI